jgi:murein DD-endopeptidase MepM/ murein hydrolase activator NlpD
MISKAPIPLVAAVLSAALLSHAAAQTRSADPISLALPLACELGKTCFLQNYVDTDQSSKWKDYRCGEQTYDGHDGTDIRIPSMEEQRTGVDVLAAAPGTVMGTRDGVADVSLRHENGWTTQYCHMAKGSIRVSRGQKVETGTPLGRVGLSGNTEFPHLHFSVMHDQTKIDPFAYGAARGTCGGSGKSLWNEAVRASLGYLRGQVLNTGFAANVVTMAQIESGEVKRQPPKADSPALVAYVRAIGLEAGDVLELAVVAPDGKPFAQQRQQPLDHSKAQFFTMIGKKRGATPWPAGTYTARFQVLRDDKSVLEKTFTFDLPPS